mgnify:FL=1
MNKNMNLPAEYAVLSEEEMTYTQGGSDIGGFATTAATVVGAVVLGASYIWGISASKDWLNKKSTREGNLFTVLGRAADAGGEYMAMPAATVGRDAVSSTMAVALAPLSAVLLIL